MKNIKHWTPRYIYDRVALTIYEKRNPDHPWLTSSAISILSKHLKESDVGIEWGSGRSTYWFADKVEHLTSIESDQKWYYSIQSKMNQLNITNVKHLLIEEESLYVNIIENFEETSLNFILVDGCFNRGLCAVKAVSKLVKGGILVIDNANRYLPSNSNSPTSIPYTEAPASDDWLIFLKLIHGWKKIWTSNGIWDTALFIKP